jgi:penicillin-binding protein 1A
MGAVSIRDFLRRFCADRLRAAWSHRAVRTAAPSIGLLLALPAAWLLYRVYLDRSGLPDLEPFLRFEPPTIGRIYDAQGTVLIELAREHRQVVTWEEIPLILRQAVLAAEDKNFFSHSGVDYSALPRVVLKSARSSWSAWWKGGAPFRLVMPQGGSTLTQQLVRGYFLQDHTSRENGDALIHATPPVRVVSWVLGVPAANKLLRKLEEVRLTFWLEEEMRRHYGSKERAKQEIFARYASFLYLGNGRYGFAAGSDYYFDKPLSSYTTEDAAKAALLAGISKSPRDYAPSPGDPRPVRRRNEILALMARNGYIPETLATACQSEVLEAAVPREAPVEAPAAIQNVFDELKKYGEKIFGVEELFRGRLSVHSTVDARVQAIVNDALETGLGQYEKRHPRAKGLVQGSVVVLRNSDAAILAEAGGRRIYNERITRYSDFNRATDSLRQVGSAMKPLVYLAAFREGLDLDSLVPDEPIQVALGNRGAVKEFANFDNQFKGPMAARQALAESRNVVAVWIATAIGMREVIATARDLGIRTPLRPDVATALGASEMRLVEIANAYRAMASGVRAVPHVIRLITNAAGQPMYEGPRPSLPIRSDELRRIQEGLRGVVRLPNGTAHSLDSRSFPIPVMGKTGTTSDYRDALFVGSTYGPSGITVAVRIGFDDNRPLGAGETGGRVALPIFRAILLQVYEDHLVGPVPKFPRDVEEGIDEYLAMRAADAVASAPAGGGTLVWSFVEPRQSSK